MKVYIIIAIVVCILVAGIVITESSVLESEDSQSIREYSENNNGDSFQKLDNQIKRTWY